MEIQIINGPNLNLLGNRENEIYGNQSFEFFLEKLKKQFPAIRFKYFQSNVEGEIINALHDSGTNSDGIILNAGAYTHTSIAIADAVAAIAVPVVEVHISNIFSREDFRHLSYLGRNCAGSISGFGLQSYTLAVQYFIEKDLKV